MNQDRARHDGETHGRDKLTVAVAELERRWAEMMTARGDDPAPGSGHRLASQVTAADFVVDAEQHRFDDLAVERSSAWTARQAMLTAAIRQPQTSPRSIAGCEPRASAMSAAPDRSRTAPALNEADLSIMFPAHSGLPDRTALTCLKGTADHRRRTRNSLRNT
jgi:hypothetical protein